MHKVQLVHISAKTDLKGLVVRLSALLGLPPKAVVELLKGLPITLLEKAPPEKALALQEQIEAFGHCQVKIDPPVPLAPEPTSLEEIHAPKTTRRILPLALVLGILVITASLLWWGKKMIPLAPSVPEIPLAGNLPQVQELIAKAHADQERSGWKNYGRPGEEPYEGQDRLPDPRLDTAYRLLREDLAKNPHNAQAQSLLAQLYLEKGLIPEAVLAAEAAVQADSSQVAFLNLLGRAYLEAGQDGQAELQFHKAIRRFPQSADAYRNLGIQLLEHSLDSALGIQWLHTYLQKSASDAFDRKELQKECAAVAVHYYNGDFTGYYPPRIGFEEYEAKRRHLEADLQRRGNTEAEWAMAQLALSRGMKDVARTYLQRLYQRRELNDLGLRYLALVYMDTQAWEAALGVLNYAAGHSDDPFFSKNLGLLQYYYGLEDGAAKEAWEAYFGQRGDAYAEKIRLLYNPLR